MQDVTQRVPVLSVAAAAAAQPKEGSSNSSSSNSSGSGGTTARRHTRTIGKPTRVSFLILGEPDGGAGALLAHVLGSETLLHPHTATLASESAPVHRRILVEDTEYSLELHTNLGFGRLCGVSDGAARDAQAFAFVFDVTKRHTYLAFETWREWLSQLRADLESVPLLLLGIAPSQLVVSPLDSSASSSGSNSNGNAVSSASAGKPLSLSPPTSPGRHASAGLESSDGTNLAFTLSSLRSVDHNEATQLAEAYGCRYREVSLPSPGSTESDALLDPFIALIKAIHKDGRSALSGDTSAAAMSTAKAVDLTLVGDSFSGKSALLEKLTSGKFRSKYTSTSDPRLVKHKLGVDGTLYLLRVRDTCGWAGIEGLTREQLQLTHCVLLVFDLTNLQSLHALKAYYDGISSIKQDKKVAYVLVGAKSDLIAHPEDSLLTRAVPFEQAKSLAKQWNCPYIEFSSKTGDSLDLLRVAIRQVRYVFDESSGASLPSTISGFMNIKSPNSSKFKRKFVQFLDGTLSWWSDEPHHGNASTSTKTKNTLELSLDTEISSPSSDSGEAASRWGFSVTIKSGKKTLVMATPSPSERDAWVAALLSAVAVQKVANGLIDEFVREALRELRQLAPNAGAATITPFASASIDSILQKRLSKIRD